MRSKPSPALVISIVALIVALGGTAVAAGIFITSSSQIKNGTIRGADLRKGTITKSRLAPGILGTITGSSVVTPNGTEALEAHRHLGPDMAQGGSAAVLELALPSGTYAVFGKATMTPYIKDDGLLDTLFRERKTIGGACTLDVNGTGDYAIEPMVSPGSTNPVTLNTQLTRSIDAPGKATLTCQSTDKVHWSAANTSIIALRVGSTSRTEAAR
jgi:hypothetical protein